MANGNFTISLSVRDLLAIVVLGGSVVTITMYITGIRSDLEAYIASELEHRENCQLIRQNMLDTITEHELWIRKHDNHMNEWRTENQYVIDMMKRHLEKAGEIDH